MFPPDTLRRLNSGEPLDPEQINQIMAAMQGLRISGENLWTTPHGTTIVSPPGGGGAPLIRFQITGAHSLAAVLDCTLGVWNPATHNDAFTGDAAKCIDRRLNVPVADDNATGVGFWMPSDTHGRIVYIIDLDCPAAEES